MRKMEGLAKTETYIEETFAKFQREEGDYDIKTNNERRKTTKNAESGRDVVDS